MNFSPACVLAFCSASALLKTKRHAPENRQLVNYPPKVAVSNLVNSLKGVSSRLVRKKNYPSIQKKLWGNMLWSPSYFAGSCGGAPIAVIRQYIEQQQTPH